MNGFTTVPNDSSNIINTITTTTTTTNVADNNNNNNNKRRKLLKVSQTILPKGHSLKIIDIYIEKQWIPEGRPDLWI